MEKLMVRSILLSTFLHLCVIFLFLFHLQSSHKNKKGNPNHENDNTTFIAKESEPIMISELDWEGLTGKKKKAKKEKCKHSYNGVGLMSSGFPSLDAVEKVAGLMLEGNIIYQVTEIAPGYSADRAGIKVGDTVVSKEDLWGKVGTTVEVRVIHQKGAEELLTLTREKICTK